MISLILHAALPWESGRVISKFHSSARACTLHEVLPQGGLAAAAREAAIFCPNEYLMNRIAQAAAEAEEGVEELAANWTYGLSPLFDPLPGWVPLRFPTGSSTATSVDFGIQTLEMANVAGAKFHIVGFMGLDQGRLPTGGNWGIFMSKILECVGKIPLPPVEILYWVKVTGGHEGTRLSYCQRYDILQPYLSRDGFMPLLKRIWEGVITDRRIGDEVVANRGISEITFYFCDDAHLPGAAIAEAGRVALSAFV